MMLIVLTQVLALERGGCTMPTVVLDKILLLASKQRYREKANFWNALVAAPGREGAAGSMNFRSPRALPPASASDFTLRFFKLPLSLYCAIATCSNVRRALEGAAGQRPLAF
jgi:hypothetical protein